MKEKQIKLMLVMLGLGTLSFLLGLYTYSTLSELRPYHYMFAVAVLVGVFVSILIGLQRLKELKQGLAIEDEMSKRIVEKPSARTFLHSLYVWFLIMIFTVDKGVSSEMVIGSGLVGTGILFFVNWTYLTKTGIDENAH